MYGVSQESLKETLCVNGCLHLLNLVFKFLILWNVIKTPFPVLAHPCAKVNHVQKSQIKFVI